MNYLRRKLAEPSTWAALSAAAITAAVVPGVWAILAFAFAAVGIILNETPPPKE